MLEKPDLQDELIISCLQDEYGVHAAQVAFLPLGADLNAAAYRLVADDETPYFLKLRRGVFDEISVTLPKFLSDQGIGQIITPITTKTGQLWARMDSYRAGIGLYCRCIRLEEAGHGVGRGRPTVFGKSRESREWTGCGVW